MNTQSRIEALEERMQCPQMTPEARRGRIRELCRELGYPVLPPDDDPDYPAACERLLERLRANQRERQNFGNSPAEFWKCPAEFLGERRIYRNQSNEFRR